MFAGFFVVHEAGEGGVHLRRANEWRIALGGNLLNTYAQARRPPGDGRARASYVQGFPESAKPLDLGFVRMAN